MVVAVVAAAAAAVVVVVVVVVKQQQKQQQKPSQFTQFQRPSTDELSCNHGPVSAGDISWSASVRAGKYVITIFRPIPSVALPHFYTLFHKRHDFQQKLLNIKCVF